MFRRLLPLAPLTPALAVIAFAAAGAAAQGVAGLARPSNSISDVQIGERGKLMRVVVVCREECRVGARASGVYFVPGVTEDLEVDLTGRAANAQRLTFRAETGGAELTVRSEKPIVASTIKRCAAGGAPAACIDIEFAERSAASAAGPAPEKSGPPMLGHVGPLLREAPDERKLVFARLAPPERFAPPPMPAPRPDKTSEGDGPRLILESRKAEALLGARVDIGAEAAQILGRKFGAAECAIAETRLKADAWALGAMVDIGFCEAIRGDLAAAEGVFDRLLAYTPDNYEALVGRALIAARKGDRAEAEGRFQEALNALPPIAESDRIVAAMARL